MSTVQAYRAYLARQLKPFPCPTCHESLLPRHFEEHCLNKHYLNPKVCCVWCKAGESWPSRQKKNHVRHLISCMRSVYRPLYKPHQPTDLQLKPVVVPSDPTSMGLKRSLFHHAFDPVPGAYDSSYPQPLDTVPRLYENDTLNLAVACVQTYLRLRETTEWYHVKVRTVGFSAFVEALNPQTRTLPFSCWCDGGKPTEASYRQHRHFILVSPPGYYATWVRSLAPDHRPQKSFKCFLSKRIQSAMHLVNIIGNLCNRISRCKFASKGTETTEKDNHFYLFEELPRDYRLPLVLQWPGGLDELLHQKYRQFMRQELIQAPLFQKNGKWRLKIRDIPGIVLGTVLPVARDFEPCDEETDTFVHLLGDRKLYFKRNPELLQLDPETWLQTQADKGNAFYHVVGDDTWTPQPLYQALINDFKSFVDENRELEARLAERERDFQPLVDRNKELEARLAKRERDFQHLVDRNRKLVNRNRELEAHLAERELDFQPLVDRNRELEARLAQQTPKRGKR